MTGKPQIPVSSPFPAHRKSYPLPEAVRTTGEALAAASPGEDQPSDRVFDRYIEAGVVKSSDLS